MIISDSARVVQPSLAGHPLIIKDVGPQRRIGIAASRISRRDHELKALRVSRRRPRATVILRHPIHFTPGATPIWFPAPSSLTVVPAVCRAVAAVVT